jgi:starch phosphorylase
MPEFRKRVVFLEDYDMNIARYLVHGVDVWLNNPRRPLEASGTSGMKVPVNGGLNLSILDGWWVEGYAGDNGWAIGAGEEYSDTRYQDEVEGRLIYELIERDIVPAFYQRGADGLPRDWIRRMKRSISTVVPVFNTNRMVEEYLMNCYLPAHRREMRLSQDGMHGAKELSNWRRKIAAEWPAIRIEEVQAPTGQLLKVGKEFPVQVRAQIGSLRASEIDVQLCYGTLDASGELVQPTVFSLMPQAPDQSGQVLFTGTVPCRESGHFGFAVRILPKHENLANQYEPNLVTWG